ncbi:MAG: ABC transporter ATP-binding protein [Clostridiales bacterium]|nr:ABC transporter ATP-binding protein [Clostridiales bacterium]
MIRLEKITKTYTTGGVDTYALKEVNLEVQRGEYLAIMGKSGSGKSTLLNILGGMDTMTSGEYWFGDIAVHKLSRRELHQFRKKQVSFVFQQFALMNRYTVYENVELPLLIRGMKKKERKKVVMEKLDMLGIAELSKKLPIHISGGQQQCCAVARALAAGNELFLADEPTGALDQENSLEMMEIFDKINKQGKTIIMITHDEDIAGRAKRLVRIHDGYLLQEPDNHK